MLIKTHRDGFNHPLSSEITPQTIYTGRRDLMKFMATGVAGAAMATWAGREAHAQGSARPGKLAALAGVKSSVAGALVMDKVTGYKDASTYNNFYEFGTDKADPARNAHTLKTTPWTVEIEGLVKKPAKYTLEGELTSIVKQSNTTKDVFYKFTLKMIDVEEGTIEWQDEKEIRKTSKR